MRQLQDRFDTRRLADRLDEQLGRTAFTDEDRAFIESRADVLPRHRRRAGPARLFVQGRRPRLRARAPATTSWRFPATTATACSAAWATCSSIPRSALLFIDFERPNRLRVNGRRVDRRRRSAAARASPARSSWCACAPSASFRTARATSTAWRRSSRRPTFRAQGYTPPVPKWKTFDAFRDVLARDDPARGKDG